jgi:primary-amine oxidase
VVDLNTMAVLRIEDAGGAPIPPEPGEYAREFYQDRFRQDVKPLAITQPEGPSFEVEGHQIRWQRWQMRIGFTPREGLVLYQVGYEDQGNLRPILYRASMAEMVVPYGDPGPSTFVKMPLIWGNTGWECWPIPSLMAATVWGRFATLTRC